MPDPLNPKNWKKTEIQTFRRLRENFLRPQDLREPYWQSEEVLALYDATFGERIGWKWDAVLQELQLRGWNPSGKTLIDWGCGTGIASRRVLSQWKFDSVLLHDLSPGAIRFAGQKIREQHPGIHIDRLDSVPPKNSVLLLSHVANELSEAMFQKLLNLAGQCEAVFWVDSGTYATSRKLIAVRESLKEKFHAVAPCTHQATCGMLEPSNEQHWCHHFTIPPSFIFQDAKWMEWGKLLGIDLRSLPYSFLVLQKKETGFSFPENYSRIIGRCRDYKGYSKILSCQECGVREFVLQKRDDPALLKEIQKTPSSPLYQWQLEENKITGAERFQ